MPYYSHSRWSTRRRQVSAVVVVLSLVALGALAQVTMSGDGRADRGVDLVSRQDRATGARDPQARARPDVDYVALGDSFSAGPGLPGQSFASPECERSHLNYPSILARDLATRSFVDVTCTGAESADLLEGQVVAGTRLAPQVESVQRGTDLVTVGVGGNDRGFYARLLRACSATSTTVLRACSAGGLAEQGLQRLLDELAESLGSVLAAVRQRAPEATVVVVGYPSLFGGSACPALPWAEAQRSWASGALVRLNDVLDETATRAGASYTDLEGVTDAHGICAREPWFNGEVGEEGDAFHPRVDGMAAAAAAVLRTLVSSGFTQPAHVEHRRR